MFALPALTQTTVTISGSVETAGIDPPNINLGGIASYGSQQLIKSLNYAAGGYFPGTYATTTYQCSSGGRNTSTSWYNNITTPAGYHENFWAGATFVAINAALVESVTMDRFHSPSGSTVRTAGEKWFTPARGTTRPATISDVVSLNYDVPEPMARRCDDATT